MEDEEEGSSEGRHLSMKLVLTLYSVFLIICTGVMTAVMSISSGESALESSQDACDVGLVQCFGVGRAETAEMGQILMAEVINGIESAIDQRVSVPLSLLLVEEHMSRAHGIGRGNHTYDKQIHDDQMRKLTLSLIESSQDIAHVEVTVRTLDATTDDSIFYLMSAGFTVPPEDRATSPDWFLGFEVVNGKWNDITQGTLIASIIDHDTGHISTEPLETTQNCSASYIEIENWRVSKGSSTFNQCQAPLSSLGQTTTGRGTAAWLPHIQYGAFGWAPLEGKGEYISVSAYYAWVDAPGGSYGPNSGFWYTIGVALDDLTEIVKSSLSGLPNESRIYVVERDPWLEKMGSLLAVSHGNAYFINTTTPIVSHETITPSQAADPVIAAHGKGTEALSDDPYTLQTTGTVNETWMYNDKEWWVLMRMMKISPMSQHPLVMTIVVLLDSEIALRSVTASFNTVSKVIQRERDDVNDQTAENITYLWMSLSGMLLFLASVAWFCSHRIASSITSLAEEMNLVETWELEDINLSEPSILTEVNGMQKSFRTMLDSLKEFRAYLPKVTVATGLRIQTEGDDDDVDKESKETGSSFHSIARPTPAPTPRDITTTTFGSKLDSATLPPTPAEKEGSGSSHTPKKITRRRSLGAGLLCAMKEDRAPLTYRKGVVVLTVKLQGMHEWVASSAYIDNLVEYMSEWVERIEQHVTANKGTLLSTALGDGEMTAVWGYNKRDFTGLTTAVDAALCITSQTQLSMAERTAPVETYAALTEGMGWAGNLGSNKTRSPVVVGPHLKENTGCLEVGMHHGTKVVTSSHSGLEAYEVLPVDCCYLNSTVSRNGVRHGKGGPRMVYQIVRKNKQGEEWMYALNAKQQRTKPIFEAYEMYKSGDVLEAEKLAKVLAMSNSPLRPEATRLLELIQASRRKDEHYPTPPNEPAPTPPTTPPPLFVTSRISSPITTRNPLTTPRGTRNLSPLPTPKGAQSPAP